MPAATEPGMGVKRGGGSGLQPCQDRSSTLTFRAKGESMHTPIDASRFCKIMSRFATGVTVVTTRSGQDIHGLTCNAFCSISLNPCTVMVSVAKDARSWPLIDQSRLFAVNVLSEHQSFISDRFAGRHRDKDDNRFEGIDWSTAVTGAPILDGTQGYLDCRVTRAYDGGTHTLFLGEVVALNLDDSRPPLVFYGSRYMGIDGLKAL